MRYLTLILLFGCSNYSELQSNINEFTRNCKELAGCMEKPYEINIDLNSRRKLSCIIKHSNITKAVLHVSEYFDLEVRPTFGYGFLESAIEVCKINKNIGRYSKENQNALIRYNKCVNLAPNDKEQEILCRKQYKPYIQEAYNEEK